jgi:hypothetical protein
MVSPSGDASKIARPAIDSSAPFRAPTTAPSVCDVDEIFLGSKNMMMAMPRN